jgi:hypothetical protein
VHVAAGVAVGVMAFGVLVLLAGMTPLLGIPIALVLFLVPVLWGVTAARSAGEPSGLDKSGVPSSGEASYQPVTDPAKRP